MDYVPTSPEQHRLKRILLGWDVVILLFACIGIAIAAKDASDGDGAAIVSIILSILWFFFVCRNIWGLHKNQGAGIITSHIWMFAVYAVAYLIVAIGAFVSGAVGTGVWGLFDVVFGAAGIYLSVRYRKSVTHKPPVDGAGTAASYA
eukprot:TRINITY_DN23227_c0_g1_i1.p1 TRINITY_DN23227_c0_g1~~TRINITY_DN23227_c0_g1_i1.p1  ORF type:complete len:147 (+),score=19.96 TRINITY_DN23227_c0_g1_i1:161-601(+)